MKVENTKKYLEDRLQRISVIIQKFEIEIDQALLVRDIEKAFLKSHALRMAKEDFAKISSKYKKFIKKGTTV